MGRANTVIKSMNWNDSGNYLLLVANANADYKCFIRCGRDEKQPRWWCRVDALSGGRHWYCVVSFQMEAENEKSAGNRDKADVWSAPMAGTSSDVDPCASRINQEPNCCQWSCSKRMCLGSSGLYQVHAVSFMSGWIKGFPACYCRNMIIVHLSSQWRRCSDSSRPSAKEKRAHSWRPSSLRKINQSLMLRQLLICWCAHK